MNSDSAVPPGTMSREQTFRSEPSLSLRLIRLWQKWVSAEQAFKVQGSRFKVIALVPTLNFEH
jgi:hypothetical protein